MDVTVYSHTHWDREWYQPFEEYRLRLIRVMDSVIEELESGRMNSFYFDGQTGAIEDYLEIHPEKDETIKKLVLGKKLYLGPWYVLADEFLVGAESLIRNLMTGMPKARELGCNDFIGYLPDAFGHNSQMPKIFASFGIKDAIVWRGVDDQKTHFIWQSDDGSGVFTVHLPEGYLIDAFNYTCPVERKAEIIKGLLDKIKQWSNSDNLLLPAGGDHLAPAPDINGCIEKLNSLIEGYTLRQDTLFSYLEKVKAENQDLSSFTGELRDCSRTFILPGTYSSRIYLKQQNVRAEWLLGRVAEPMHAFLYKMGIADNRSKELSYAWKLLLQNHAHDSICGCSVDPVHREMMPRFEKVTQVAEGVISRWLYQVSQRVSRDSYAVFNASKYAYTGPVSIKSDRKIPLGDNVQYIGITREFPQEILNNIQQIPIQEDIKPYYNYLVWQENLPGMSLTVYKPEKDKEKGFETVTLDETTLSNGIVKLKVKGDGTVDFENLVTGKVFTGLHSVEDRADIGDTYNFCPIVADEGLRAKFNGCKVLERGTLSSSLRITYELNIPESADKHKEKRSPKVLKHYITTDITLYAGSARADFATHWENKSKDHTLQVKFNLQEKIHGTVSEDTLGVIQRDFDPDYSLRNAMPAAKGQELKYNTAPMQRFVAANGIGIITEGLHEYGVDDTELYITLVRCIGKLSGGALATRGTPAGPPLDVQEAQCLGLQSARYSLVFYENVSEMFRHADEFMGSVRTVQGIVEGTVLQSALTWLRVDNPAVNVYAVKTSEKDNKDTVVRLYNTSAKSQNVCLNSDLLYTRILETDPLEEKAFNEQSIDDPIEFRPFELKTIKLS